MNSNSNSHVYRAKKKKKRRKREAQQMWTQNINPNAAYDCHAITSKR